MYTVSITSQGQINIPAKLRRAFKLQKSKKANVYATDEGILIKPVKDFLELSGSFRTTKKPLTNTELHKHFATYMAFRKKRPQLPK